MIIETETITTMQLSLQDITDIFEEIGVDYIRDTIFNYYEIEGWYNITKIEVAEHGLKLTIEEAGDMQ